MFCPQCGNKNPDNARFCAHCGYQFRQYEAAPQIAQPQPKAHISTRRIVPIAAAVAIAAVAIVLVRVVLRPGPVHGVKVRDSADDYSWQEMSQIAAAISEADTDEAGLKIAESYHLEVGDGKYLTLSDGTDVEMQICGFRHDDKSDGSGKAGISFLSAYVVGSLQEPMGASNEGGWEKSDMRSYLNSDMLGALPQDLQSVIVPVNKYTNNESGEAEDASAITPTSDKIWIPSFVEVCGAGENEAALAEGTQYQLFSDAGIGPDTESCPDETWKTQNVDEPKWGDQWWLRSPCPESTVSFHTVGTTGVLGLSPGTYLSGYASDANYFAIGFCL